MKKLFCLILSVFVLRIIAIAQVNLAAGGTISQNFDKMAKTAKAQLPSGWRVGTSTHPGEISSYSFAGTSTELSGGVSIASNASGGIYNFGAGDPETATERAIGGLSTGSAAKSVTLFVALYNNGDDTIGSYTISYDVEKYRNGLNAKGCGVKLLYMTEGGRWSEPGPVFTTSFPADPNNSGATSVPISMKSVVSKTLPLSLDNIVPPGKSFYLAWNYSVNSEDINASTANAQALGIDNIIVSAKAKVSPPVLKAETLRGWGNVCVGATSSAASFKLTGSRLNGSAIMVGPLDGYRFSTTATGKFNNTLSLSYEGNALEETIYVKFFPEEARSYAGNIPVSGGNAATINVVVSGAGINTGPAVSTGIANNITSTSATVAGTITNLGCSAITGYGIEYSTTDGFTTGSGITISGSNLTNGTFYSDIAELSANTTYYYRAYATNNGGTSYGAQQSFTTTTQPAISLEVVAIPATDTMPNSFTANWHPATGDAISYRLDVSTTNDFVDDQAVVTIANWTFPDLSADAVADTANSINANKIITTTGANAPTFNSNGATSKAARAIGWDEGSGGSYWQVELNTTGQQNLLLSSKQRSSSTGPKDFNIQYKIGSTGTWTDISSPSVTVADNFTTGAVINKLLPEVCNNQPAVFIRWIMTSNISVDGSSVGSTGSSLIDDILVAGNPDTYVAGYKDLLVNDTFQFVTGLSPHTTYYYRVRAFNEKAISPNSNIISVTTTEEDKEPLPSTTLLYFSGKEQNNKNALQWATAIENNNQGFDVQRSSDSMDFQSIGFVPSSVMDGNSVEATDYTFDDYGIVSSDSQFYRLEVINLDGTSFFSDVILIRKEKKTEVISIDGLYPNPASGSINLKINVPSPQRFTCSIVDSKGYILKQFLLHAETGSNVFKIDITGVSPGTYHLKCISQSGAVAARKFIVR